MSKALIKVEESKLSVRPYYPLLKDLEEEHGALTPDLVVNAAADDESPLHEYFEWDDSLAGIRYRKIQARMLISAVKIEIMGQRTNAYTSVVASLEDDNQRNRRYISTEVALSDEEMTAQMIAGALKELTYWQMKYKSLTQLKGIINQEKVESIKKSLKGGE